MDSTVVTNEVEHRKYQHVERIGTDEVEEILNGTVHVFQKIDGTNGSVWFENGKIQAGSSKRLLSLEKDNAGFCKFTQEDSRFAEFFKEYPDYTLFGEWLIPNAIKTYRATAWKKFYIFDVKDETDKYMAYDEFKPILEKFGFEFIPVICVLENPTVEEIIDAAKNSHFLQDEGNVAEGLVIKNYNYLNKYGRAVWAKIVYGEFKDVKKGNRIKKQEKQAVDVIDEIIENFVTEDFIQKEKYKFLAGEGWSDRKLGLFLSVIWKEFLAEETFNILKKYKLPTIDFRQLNKEFIEKVKDVVLR